MFNVFLKFLIILEVNLKLTKSTNIVLELRYRHNNLENLKLLIELLENYFELLINIFCNICFYLLLLKYTIIFAFLLIVKSNLNNCRYS